MKRFSAKKGGGGDKGFHFFLHIKSYILYLNNPFGEYHKRSLYQIAIYKWYIDGAKQGPLPQTDGGAELSKLGQPTPTPLIAA